MGGEIVVGEAKANCPVSTEKTRPGGVHGELRASITSKVSGNECVVGTNCSYGSYVEYGTYKMKPQSFLIPALLSKKSEVVNVVLEEVKKI